MRYIQFMPKAQPTILSALSHTGQIGGLHQTVIEHRQNMFEFVINTDASFVVQTEHETVYLRPHDIIVYLPNRKYTVTPVTEGEGTQTNTTHSVVVEIPDFSYSCYDTALGHSLPYISGTDVYNRSLLLPEYVHLSEKEHRDFTSVFRVLTNHYFSGTASEYYHAIARWYDLAAMLDNKVHAELQLLRTSLADNAHEPSLDLYIKKTKKFISAHYSEKLSVPMIAEHLNITPNYLSTIFKKGTGETVIEYLNYYRMLKLREILLQPKTNTLSDLCMKVGIQDKRYAQRLFKKYFGVSMQRCLHLETGKTLPQEDFGDADHWGAESNTFGESDSED